ncbi:MULTISPECIES: ATP-dependent DNA helicase [Phaeobacter]|uniref:Exonuclease V subunit alpha n=1 Tax=Phaeobacter inhibens TaxID=221822 RepID=A0A2I7K585_9RHOB|nr:AAA family ATPase [Phaeobacter inhibens]AUQ97650.1 exonuclease V subunit alpha [Phaeobacter inhibens]
MNMLNAEQNAVVNAIASMQGGDRLVVSGRAGSGKTYAIANSVSDRKALFLTPTHPARSVLEQELPDKRHKVMTIHSAIGWYKGRDNDLEAVEGYRPAKKAGRGGESASAFAKADIIIVDEFSMVGSFLFRAVEEYANEFDLPVVYSGDRFQLPPVQDREVITKQGFPTITLNKSMRFSEDSEIFKLGELLRDAIENRPTDDLPCLFGRDAVRVVPGQTWMDGLTSEYSRGGNLLAVTADNETLRRLRHKVRQVDHDRLCAGDVVMSKQTDDQFRNGERFTIQNVGRDIRILSDVPRCLSRSHELKVNGYALGFDGTNKIAFVLKREKDADKLSKRIHDLYNKGELDRDEAGRVLDWLDGINRFELSTLATVHKSQGRSVDTVYIDTATVLRKPHWLSPITHKRLLYTAITRARKEVVFYQMPTYCTADETNLLMAA